SLATEIATEAQNSGVSQDMIPAVVEAGKTAGKVIDPTLADHLAKIGVNFQELYAKANFDGMVIAINQMSTIIIAIAVAAFIAAVFVLPNTNGSPGGPDQRNK
ncbi:MAG: MFS transporter, partial [Desulfitobacterium hafniense]